MRRGVRTLVTLVALGLVLAAGVAGFSAPVAAQTGPSVTMTMTFQSAWNSPERPLTIKLDVSNPGPAPLTNLVFTLTIGFPAGSRSVYEETLRFDPTSALFTTPFFEGGSIAAGGTRSFTIHQPLDSVFGLQSWSLDPLRIELHAAGALVATLRTPMIFLGQTPTVPLNMAWTFELSEPLQIGPDGVFERGPIESDVAPAGWLAQVVHALNQPVPVPVDLAVSPVLITELRAMARGYRIVGANGAVQSVPIGTGGSANAADVLNILQGLIKAGQAEVTAMPLGDASLPAIQRSGLGNLATLIDKGRAEVQSALSTTSSTTMFRPPGSAIDAESFGELVDAGVQTLLFDPGFIPPPAELAPPAPLVLAPPSVGEIIVGVRKATAVLPDLDLAKLTTTYPNDPVLAAHAALGLMASTWLVAPGTGGRGIAMLFPENDAAPPAILATLVALVAASPWLRPERVSTFVAEVPSPLGRVEGLPRRHYRGFQDSYLQRLRGAQAALRQFKATAGGPGSIALEATLANHLLTAEAGAFVLDPALGLRYIDAVDGPRGPIWRTYREVTPPPNGYPFTLTSRRGRLPFKVRNDSPYLLSVRVVLSADPRLKFVLGGVQTVQLPPHSNVPITFQVNAETTGGFPLHIRIKTAGGTTTIATSDVVVRSTAYNLVALFVTIGAGLFLAVWWGRGALRRRRS